ncbi:hypothetical protein [Amycolatopsis samaneae]|uniref:hypothetical protein n=1 Tax=Amycolatopsis samaneae TaxID=664691 RepID=UPI0031E849B0
MSAALPPNLADLARERRLGELEDRFGYRPGVAGALLLAFVGSTAAGNLVRVVSGAAGTAEGVATVVVLALVAWRVRRMCARLRGGVYLFEGGIAEAYGNRRRHAARRQAGRGAAGGDDGREPDRPAASAVSRPAADASRTTMDTAQRVVTPVPGGRPAPGTARAAPAPGWSSRAASR